jgi:hypothetical protein
MLISRFGSRVTLTPKPAAAIAGNFRDWMFDRLLAGYKQVDPLLAADKAAIGTKDAYDDEYFEKFFTAMKPQLDQELSDAITATASAIVTAWEQAGRPVIPMSDPQSLEKVRK